MSFGEDLVEIKYQATVQGLENVGSMVAVTEDLNTVTNKYSAGLAAQEAVLQRQARSQTLALNLSEAVANSIRRNVSSVNLASAAETRRIATLGALAGVMAEVNVVQGSYAAGLAAQEAVQKRASEAEVLSVALGDAVFNSLNKNTEARVKNTNTLLNAHSAVRRLHRELFVGASIIGLVTFALSAMAKGSESAQIGLDKLNSVLTKGGGNIGNMASWAVAYAGALSTGLGNARAVQTADDMLLNNKSIETQAKALDMKSKLLTMESDIYKTKGDELMSIKKKQQAEDESLKAEQIINEKNTGEKLYQITKDALSSKKDLLAQGHAAEMEAFRLHSMGLKQQAEIDSQFKKQVVGGTQQTSSNVLQNFLNGEKQTGMDIVNAFRANFNKAVSDAFTESLFAGKGFGGFFKNLTDMFTGKKPEVELAEKSNARLAEISDFNERMADCICSAAETLKRIEECTCSTAQQIGGAIPTSVNFSPGKESTWSKLATITGAIGSIAGGIGGLGGLGGVPTPVNPGTMPPAGMAPMAGPEFMPSISMPGGAIGHSGMEVPKFPSGGEVPIMAQPGEFIVRKSAAQDNKDLLKSMNSGARQSKGAQNIYFINANDAKSFSDMLSSPSAQQTMEMQITRAIMNNGSLRDAIRSFGRG